MFIHWGPVSIVGTEIGWSRGGERRGRSDPKTGNVPVEVYDNLYRIVESSFGYQDMVQGTLDAYLSTVNNRLNETMKRLTVISAIFAALTVITGVYGMNFQHMPELQWRYGYFVILAFMAFVAAGLVWLFKRNRWI